jgi:cAMP-dependent protein kinase regulator
MRLPFSRPKIADLDRYLANREYDKALAAVITELRKNPQQFNLLLRQAEILGMAGDRTKAIEVYRDVAERYARDGFFAKAIALYKKVLRLDPALEEVNAELARLIEEERKGRPPSEQPNPTHAPRRFEATLATETAADEQEIKELQASALFSSFREQALEKILTSTSLRSFQEGDIIVTEGEEGSSLFLIVSGEVKVFTRGERGEHLPLAELGPGDFFGEVSLLTGKPRTATITAKSLVTAIELHKHSVDEIAKEHPEVREVLEEFYERRAQDTVEAVIRRLRGES